jgi:hypothetical protein
MLAEVGDEEEEDRCAASRMDLPESSKATRIERTTNWRGGDRKSARAICESRVIEKLGKSNGQDIMVGLVKGFVGIVRFGREESARKQQSVKSRLKSRRRLHLQREAESAFC